jgi:hypothetical protein
VVAVFTFVAPPSTPPEPFTPTATMFEASRIDTHHSTTAQEPDGTDGSLITALRVPGSSSRPQPAYVVP